MTSKLRISVVNERPKTDKHHTLVLGTANRYNFEPYCENWDEVKTLIDAGKSLYVPVETVELSSIVEANIMDLTGNDQVSYCTITSNISHTFPILILDLDVNVNSWLCKPNILAGNRPYINPKKTFDLIIKYHMYYETHRIKMILSEHKIDTTNIEFSIEATNRMRSIELTPIICVRVSLTSNQDIKEGVVAAGAIALALKPLNYSIQTVKLNTGYRNIQITFTGEPIIL